MKRQLISCILAVFMTAGMFLFPAAAEDTSVLAEMYYDAETDALIKQNIQLTEEEGKIAVDKENQALKIVVSGSEAGGDGATRAFTAALPDRGADTAGNTVTYEIVMNPQAAGTNRNFQAFYPTASGDKNMTILKTNPSGTCFLLGKEGEQDGFALPNNTKVKIVFTFRLGEKKASAVVTNLTKEGEQLFELNDVDIPFDSIIKFKHEFSPKQADGDKITYIYSLRAEVIKGNSIGVQTWAVGMPPYTAGDAAQIRMNYTGEAPVRATAYCNTQNLGTREAANGFFWQTAALQAGTHRIFVTAEYADGSKLEQKATVTAKEYTAANQYLDCDMSDSGAIRGQNGATGGVSGGQSKVEYVPMPGVQGQGNALKLFPAQVPEDGKVDDYNMNFNTVLEAQKTDANLVVWESDLMFGNNQWDTQGKDADGQAGVEAKVRINGADKDLPCGPLVRAKSDGNLYFAGSSLTVPYEKEQLYHLKLQLNLATGKYNVIMADTDGPVYSGYSLTFYENPDEITAFIRFKYQQNASATGTDVGSYLDNVKIYTQKESGSYLDTLDIRKNAAPQYELSGIKKGDTFEFRASVCNNSGKEYAVPTVLFAVMDEEGRVLQTAAAQMEKTVPSGTVTDIVTVTAEAQTDFPAGAYLKAFLWDGVDTMQPLVQARTY